MIDLMNKSWPNKAENTHKPTAAIRHADDASHLCLLALQVISNARPMIMIMKHDYNKVKVVCLFGQKQKHNFIFRTYTLGFIKRAEDGQWVITHDFYS